MKKRVASVLLVFSNLFFGVHLGIAGLHTFSFRGYGPGCSRYKFQERWKGQTIPMHILFPNPQRILLPSGSVFEILNSQGKVIRRLNISKGKSGRIFILCFAPIVSKIIWRKT